MGVIADATLVLTSHPIVRVTSDEVEAQRRDAELGDGVLANRIRELEARLAALHAEFEAFKACAGGDRL